MYNADTDTIGGGQGVRSHYTEFNTNADTIGEDGALGLTIQNITLILIR